MTDYLLGVIFRLFFPDTRECLVCGKEADGVCFECSEKVSRHEGMLCPKCGRSVKSDGLCVQCLKNIRPYHRGIIALFYEGKGLQMMKDYKFENKLGYADYFADEVHKKVIEYKEDIDIVTAVPSHFLKIIGKGYNPPALIARKTAQLMDKRFSGNVLRRIRYTKSMSLLKGIDRMAHVKKNFASSQKDIKGKSILIIDDVSTTGATLHICSELLMKAGARRVYVAAVCGDKSENVYRIKSEGVV